MRLSEVTDLKWPPGTEWQCANSTLAMSWPNHVQILSFASMASRQGAVKHGFVSKIAGGCSSYDVIVRDLTWPGQFFNQKLRKVCPIRHPKTRRRHAPPFFHYLRKTSRGGGAPPVRARVKGLLFDHRGPDLFLGPWFVPLGPDPVHGALIRPAGQVVKSRGFESETPENIYKCTPSLPIAHPRN